MVVKVLQEVVGEEKLRNTSRGEKEEAVGMEEEEKEDEVLGQKEEKEKEEVKEKEDGNISSFVVCLQFSEHNFYI